MDRAPRPAPAGRGVHGCRQTSCCHGAGSRPTRYGNPPIAPAPVQGLSAVSEQVRSVPLNWTASTEPDAVRDDVCRSGPFERIVPLAGRGPCAIPMVRIRRPGGRSSVLLPDSSHPYRECSFLGRRHSPYAPGADRTRRPDDGVVPSARCVSFVLGASLESDARENRIWTKKSSWVQGTKKRRAGAVALARRCVLSNLTWQ